MKNTEQEILTTSQAAKICHVTRFTVRNWVNGGRLKSRVTAGGHRRILKEDLVKFMSANNIGGISKNDIKYLTPRCWESKSSKTSDDHNCEKCLVYKEAAEKCFLLVRKFGSERVQCQHECIACEYMRKHYPKEWNVIRKMIKPEEGKADVDNDKDVIKQGFYKSGKYIASITNIFSGKKKENS